jgi:predicted metal-dependent hydrolase
MARRDHSRDRLRQRVKHWSKRLKVRPRVVRVQRMTRKWGSCSTNGIVTLADDLAQKKRGFQDFVIAHELLHLRVPNHGKVFKALMNLHVPAWRKLDVERGAPSESSRSTVNPRLGLG